MLLDKDVLVEILSPDADNADKEGYVPHAAFPTTVSGQLSAYAKMNIQPASAEVVALTGGQVGKTFTGFTTASGIVETMRVTVSGTQDKYVVRHRQRYDYCVHRHSELTLFKGVR